MCHRDIKPQNIMFDNSEVKLVDFGTSKLMRKSNQLEIDSTEVEEN